MEVEITDEFASWFGALTSDDQQRGSAAVDVLSERGAGLRRPLVGKLEFSRHDMRELRPRGGHLRVLFCFDPRRQAILLLGGDKSDRWRSFYDDAIPRADDLYDVSLSELRDEGLI